jgi:hypothetical protein
LLPLWKKYPRGLVAHVTKGKVPEQCRGLAKYLAKYVASPPIAIRRLIGYSGEEVTYWYKDHHTKKKAVVTVNVMTFIGRMVQHILPKGFQRVRYHGLQATKTFKKWVHVIKEEKELQEGEDIPFGPPPEEYNYRCPLCGCEVWVNEAIIDFELGFAEFEGREVVMPVLGCPGCNRETMEYTGIKSPPEGR